MRIIQPGYQIMNPNLDDPDVPKKIYRQIEAAGRTCYKSEDRMTEESGEKFVRAMVKNGHEAMLEHASMTVKFIVDRGVSHELVRHRLCSFAQESTRYCSYNKDKFGNEITFIMPSFWQDKPVLELEWERTMQDAEKSYMTLLACGAKPEEARAVLPNSLKTEVVMTADMREWRQIFKLRAAGEHGMPHPQMLEVMVPLLTECRQKLPALFDDIEPIII